MNKDAEGGENVRKELEEGLSSPALPWLEQPVVVNVNLCLE